MQSCLTATLSFKSLPDTVYLIGTKGVYQDMIIVTNSVSCYTIITTSPYLIFKGVKTNLPVFVTNYGFDENSGNNAYKNRRFDFYLEKNSLNSAYKGVYEIQVEASIRGSNVILRKSFFIVVIDDLTLPKYWDEIIVNPQISDSIISKRDIDNALLMDNITLNYDRFYFSDEECGTMFKISTEVSFEDGTVIEGPCIYHNSTLRLLTVDV